MRNSLLAKCLLVSAALHAAAALLFLSRPLHLTTRFSTFLGKTPPTAYEDDEIARKGEALKDAFESFVSLSSLKKIPFEPQIASFENKPLSLKKPSLLLPEDYETPAPNKLPLPELEIPQERITMKSSPSMITLALTSIQPVDVDPFEVVPHFTLPISTGSSDLEISPSAESSFITQTPKIFSMDTVAPEALVTAPYFPKLEDEPFLQTPITSSFTMEQSQAVENLYVASLSSYGIPELHVLDWNETFDVEVKTLKQEEDGYLFSISLLPKVNLAQFRMKQNFYFLIDRSNSIEKHRYQTFKRAVSRTIQSLHEDDYFNIIIFDAKAVRLSDIPLPCTKKNQKLAEEFLEKEPRGIFKAATDIYSSLNQIIPTQVNSEEAHTAILISDGDSTLKPDKQRNFINTWLKNNLGRVTLYTAAVGGGNNLPILDLLGTAGRGSLLYSDTHSGFPRKLAKLVLGLRYPIAKDMTFSITPSSKIQLCPSSSRLPFLFGDRPYTFYGKADTLSDFTLTLEGKNQGNLLTIKKDISFAKAKPASRLLSKDWALEQAHICYEKYLKEGKLTFLEEAKKLADSKR